MFETFLAGSFEEGTPPPFIVLARTLIIGNHSFGERNIFRAILAAKHLMALRSNLALTAIFRKRGVRLFFRLGM